MTKLFQFKKILFVFLLFAVFSSSAQDIVIEFCPVTKVQASKGFSATMNIRNNSGVVLNLAQNDFSMEWPSLVSLPWPFSDGVQNGIDWSFKINLDWPGTLAVGATATKGFQNALFSGALQFPTGGTYSQDGVEYTVGVSHCAQTNPYELYDATVQFDRNCFIYSPTDNMCLGEAASEIWAGEGVFDVMFPLDRPSWAIGIMVAHRLFTNMAGVDMMSPNFWTATAMNESRLTCDPTITPNQGNHFKINSRANSGTGVYSPTDNCFQVLNIGYAQIENNQPDLFAQTNQYGTASYSSVIAGGAWETGALAVTYYHYQDIRYWNQIFCWNANKFHKDAQDPYAIEKIFYHAFHDGPNAGISLINDINANYDAAINATNMHDVINSNGTWSSMNIGSRKVANFTSLLDGGNGQLYDHNYNDGTQEYYGCYEADIKWSDIEYYLDQIKILYPHIVGPGIKAQIQSVFNGLNGGADVPFANLGPVIDEIVILMGGHDPSGYIATQYSASKVCDDNPIGVALRTNDTICPGETAELQVWLAGDVNYRVDIQFPDGSVQSFRDIDHSPYTIDVNTPGKYEVVYFEDDNEVGDINCNFAAITVESKNGSTVGWDKSNLDAATNCASGDLIITKNAASNELVTVAYTLDGVSQPDVVLGVNDEFKTVATGLTDGEYIITTISPNSCGTPINDTITFCGDCAKPQVEIITSDTSICDGDTVFVMLELDGTAPFDLHYKLNGVPFSTQNILEDFIVLPIWVDGDLVLDSLVDANCVNDTISNSLEIEVNDLPAVELGNDTAFCAGSTFILDAGNTGLDSKWSDASSDQTLNVDASGTYWVIVTENGCSDTDSIVVTVNDVPTVDLGKDTSICVGSLLLDVSATNVPGMTYEWSDLGNTTSQYDVLATESDIWVSVTLNSCSDTDSISVVINDVPVVDLGNDTAFCAGGELLLDAGNAGLDFEWSDASSDQTLSVNASGTYWAIVTEDGCSDTDSIVVTVNDVPSVDLGNDTSICAGDVVFDATTAGASYEWQNGSTNTTYTGNSSENVWVIVTVNNCSDTDSVALSVGGELLIDLGRDTTICLNEAPFVVDVANYATIAWEDNHGTTGSGTVFNIDSTSQVWVEVADVTGCVGRDTINVTVNDLPTIDLGPADTNVCASSGGITLNASFAGATYLWEPNGEVSPTIDVTASGEYKVAVTSAEGCVFRDSMIVTVLGSAVLDLGPVDTTLCSHLGGLTLDAGAGFTSYAWSTNATDASITVNTSGEYKVEVEDANGCIARDSIDVTINPTPVVDLGADATICATSPAATFDAGNAGATYLWSTNETTQSIQKGNGEEGDYWVIVTVNSCSDSDTVNLAVTTELTVDLGADQEICTGTTATLTAGSFGAGFNFAWNDGVAGTDNSFTGGAGTYWVEVSDAGGCTGNDTVSITEVNLLSIDLGTDQTICAGDAAVTFGMISGRTDLTIVDWNGDNTITDLTFTTNQTGTYTLNVDSAGCTASASVDLTVNALPVVSLGADTFICAGTTPTITLDAGGFAGYQWVNITNPLAPLPMGTNQTQNVSAVGTYGVVVTDVNGCVNGDTIVVGEQQSTLFSLPNDTSICPGGSIVYDVPANLQAANNGSWEWTLDNSTGLSYTVQNQNDGDQVNVELVFTNEFGCVSSDEVLVDINNNLPVSLTGATVCEGDDVTISSGFPAAGFTFLWQDGSTGNDLVLTGASLADAGAVSVDVVNTAAGCSGTGNATLTVNALPNPQLSANPICAGQDRILDHGLTGVSQVWDHGPTENPTVVLIEDRYRVTVTDVNGCEDTVSVYLTVNQAPLLNLPAGGVLCEGENNTLNTGFDDALYTHQWSGMSTATTAEITVTQGGVYAVTVTENATQCSASDQAEFVFNTVPNVDLGNDTNICVGEFVTIFSNETDPSYTYEWNTGDINLASINVDQTGWVWLDVSNGACSDRDSIAVTVFDNPLSALRNDTVLCIDDEQNGLVQLDPGRDAAGTTYRWSTGDTTQVIFANEPGFFEVTITNAAGCATYDFVTIKEDCPAHVWLPLGFTPNDDGLNDRWEIRGRNIESVQVLVFNRWGEQVWKGDRLGDFWDATFLNNPVQQDIYVYKLVYDFLNVNGALERKTVFGTVAVIR